MTLDNSGKIEVAAMAAENGGIGGAADVHATGIVQIAALGDGELVNSGTIKVTGSAKAGARIERICRRRRARHPSGRPRQPEQARQ